MKFQQRLALLLVFTFASLAMGSSAWAAATSTTKPAARHPAAHSVRSSTAAHKVGVRTAHPKRSSSKATRAKPGSAGVHKASTARIGKGRRAKPRRSTAYTRLARMQMDPARVESIQQALINAGTFHGAPTGQWDSETRDAMSRYQAANGFGVTGLPDSKSLMKLGLGPHPLPPELNKAPDAAGSQPDNSTGTISPASPSAPNKPSPNAPAATPQSSQDHR